jgi:hypothetical protein
MANLKQEIIDEEENCWTFNNAIETPQESRRVKAAPAEVLISDNKAKQNA